MRSVDIPTIIPSWRCINRGALAARIAARPHRARNALQRHYAAARHGRRAAAIPDHHPVLPPYLADPPRVIPIDVGRQLFVDDFLIEDTTLDASWHHADVSPGNPVLAARRRSGSSATMPPSATSTPTNPAAMVFSDGVLYDPTDRLFKMWYMGGYRSHLLSPPRTTASVGEADARREEGHQHRARRSTRDSSTVWLDLDERDPRAPLQDGVLVRPLTCNGVLLGRRHPLGRDRPHRPSGDRITVFYNPFRNVWVFSVRDDLTTAISGRTGATARRRVRSRRATWRANEPVPWVRADTADLAAAGHATCRSSTTSTAWPTRACCWACSPSGAASRRSAPSPTRCRVGFSRDGFHWHRPDRRAFIPRLGEHGDWNWGNVQSAGGCCLIVGDQLVLLRQRPAGRQGTDEPGVCSTGLATLRRDGFASMDWLPEQARVVKQPAADVATLTTRPIRFSGNQLFVNADAQGGDLRVEVLDVNGRTLAPLTRDACVPVNANGTRLAVNWNKGAIGDVAGREVRLRFSMRRGRLYAFWVSPDSSGRSRGYAAAGGPGINGPTC